MPTVEDDEILIDKLTMQMKLASTSLGRAVKALKRRATAEKMGVRNPLLKGLERKAYMTSLRKVQEISTKLANAYENAGKPDHRRKKK